MSGLANQKELLDKFEESCNQAPASYRSDEMQNSSTNKPHCRKRSMRDLWDLSRTMRLPSMRWTARLPSPRSQFRVKTPRGALPPVVTETRSAAARRTDPHLDAESIAMAQRISRKYGPLSWSHDRYFSITSPVESRASTAPRDAYEGNTPHG